MIKWNRLCYNSRCWRLPSPKLLIGYNELVSDQRALLAFLKATWGIAHGLEKWKILTSHGKTPMSIQRAAQSVGLED